MNTGKKKICAIICILFMILLEVAVNVLGAHPEIGNFIPAIPNRNLFGIMNMLQILIGVGVVMLDWKSYAKVAIGVLGVSAFVTVTVVMGHEGLGAIPGVVLFICGFIILTILRKQYGKREREAFSDQLTGIPNRNHFHRELGYRVAKGQPFYYVYIDLSGFKRINDVLGHVNGDYMLKEIVNYWKNLLGKDDYLARLAGDEFCMLVPEKDVADIGLYMKPFIEDIMEEEVKYDNGKNYRMVGANAGIVRFPSDSEDKDELMRKADFAMSRVKKDPDSHYCIFDKDVEEDIVSVAKVQEMVKKGFKEKTFYMVYQPQFEVGTKKLRGFEALVRLKDDLGHVISPGVFIPIMEQTGEILKMDYYVLRMSMEQFLPIVKDYPDVTISVNISARHISDERFADGVEEILKEVGFPAKNLEIEITEYSFVHSEEAAIATLDKLREMGIMIALDDFGTGYSSLSMVFRIPIDLIKIDKSMIDHIHTDDTVRKLVSQIISIGETLHCEILSEGIEQKAQADVLGDLGCNYIQGYLWGKPVIFEDAKKLVGLNMN